jgi:hypothetical protein
MGSFQAAVVRKVTKRETQARSQGFSHHNDHCQGGRGHNWTVNPTAGWKIDPDSIRTDVGFKSENSHFHGVFEKSESGFQLRGETNNHGSCVRWPITGGCCVSYDGRGALGVSATWTEYRDVETDVQERLGQGVLEWQKDLSLPLPERTVSVVVDVETLDGRKVILAMGPAQPRARDRWLEATTDLTTRLTVLRPRSAERALAF